MRKLCTKVKASKQRKEIELEDKNNTRCMLTDNKFDKRVLCALVEEVWGIEDSVVSVDEPYFAKFGHDGVVTKITAIILEQFRLVLPKRSVLLLEIKPTPIENALAVAVSIGFVTVDEEASNLSFAFDVPVPPTAWWFDWFWIWRHCEM